MGVSTKTRQAYSEIDEFISLLTEEQRNKLPTKLKEFFAEEKDSQYRKNINPSIPIKDQGLMEETLAIIALLNLQYWCESEEEKQRLKEVYAKNEKIYQETLQAKFNPDDIFKKNKKETVEEQTSIVEYKKESFISKIVSKIKNFFHIK